jgi:hypothetical protein
MYRSMVLRLCELIRLFVEGRGLCLAHEMRKQTCQHCQPPVFIPGPPVCEYEFATAAAAPPHSVRLMDEYEIIYDVMCRHKRV